MRLGDYITAFSAEQGTSLQGVFTEDYGNGIIEIQGELGINQCHKEGAVVVPDKNLFGDTRNFVNSMRRRHRWDWYGGDDCPMA